MSNNLKKKIIEILETIYDPEIGIDVWNLGMIYDIILDEGKKIVKIKMAFTTPFCPLANVIPLMIKDRVEKELKLKTDIEIVHDPPWTPERITEKGRRMFKEKYGYDIVEEWKRRNI